MRVRRDLAVKDLPLNRSTHGPQTGLEEVGRIGHREVGLGEVISALGMDSGRITSKPEVIHMPAFGSSKGSQAKPNLNLQI